MHQKSSAVLAAVLLWGTQALAQGDVTVGKTCSRNVRPVTRRTTS
jgi:hypothetical protein